MCESIVNRGTDYKTLKTSKVPENKAVTIDGELTVTMHTLFVFASHWFANWLRIIQSKDLIGYLLEKRCVLCTVPKIQTKHETKRLVEFHNHLHALTMMKPYK